MKFFIVLIGVVIWAIVYTFVYQRGIEPLRVKSQEYEKKRNEYFHNNEIEAAKKCSRKSFWYFYVSATIQVAALLPFYLFFIDIANIF